MDDSSSTRWGIFELEILIIGNSISISDGADVNITKLKVGRTGFGQSSIIVLGKIFYRNDFPPLRNLPNPFNAAVFHFPCHGQPSLWNSSASPAEISCSSAVMRATISSTASGA